jgi:hypothetical protein
MDVHGHSRAYINMFYLSIIWHSTDDRFDVCVYGGHTAFYAPLNVAEKTYTECSIAIPSLLAVMIHSGDLRFPYRMQNDHCSNQIAMHLLILYMQAAQTSHTTPYN